MKRYYLVIIAAAIGCFALGISPMKAGDDKKTVEKRMLEQAKKSGDKADKATPRYEVKKSHDEHIPATEKAAADAIRQEKPAPKAKPEAEKPPSNYEVKKSHDEHIPATEKAAADAAKKNADKK